MGSVEQLKDIKRHEITITFANMVPIEAFQGLDGVEHVEQLPNGHALRLSMQGQADAVIKMAAIVRIMQTTSAPQQISTGRVE